MNNSSFTLIDSFSRLRVAVIGESILDTYMQGRTQQLCREAPVPSVAIDDYSDACGGAANTAANVAALGARVRFLSVIGDDREGTSICRLLENRGIVTKGVIRNRRRKTLTKNRIIASSQMLVRFEQGSTQHIDKATETEICAALRDAFIDSDAVIVSDYGYGLFTPGIIDTLAALNRTAPRIVVADSRTLARLKDIGVTAAKPNYAEAAALLGIQPETGCEKRVAQICSHEQELLKATGARICAITLDRDGALIIENNTPSYRTYSRPVQEFKATGAGDTFTAAFTLALAAGADGPRAGEIASAAAAVVIAKERTESCAADELKAKLSAGDKFIDDPAWLSALCASYRARGMRIVFTNGCFDLLHKGHITHLNRAKELGDLLIVGVNSDASASRLKGRGRPVTCLDDRIQVLSALSCVDHIAVFEEDTAEGLIRTIRPHTFAKGGTYANKALPEAPLLSSLGIEIRILPYVENYSTAQILRHVRENP